MVELPWPPSVNHLYSRTRVGGIMLTKKAREHRCSAMIILNQYSGAFDAKARLVVEIIFCAPNRRKYDLDNRIKSTLDSLECSKMFPNDEQIDKLIVSRGEIIKNGSSLVTIREING